MIIITLLIPFFTLFGAIFYKRYSLNQRRNQRSNKDHFETGLNRPSIVFLHPYCNAGGGGEKVLMCMIQKLQKMGKYNIAVYSAEEANTQDIIDKANIRFNTRIVNENIKFIPILKRKLLEPQKRFTMILQLIGQMLYTYFCLEQYQPNIMIDTTGLPFSYIIMKLLLPNVKIIAYVHYPFISTDMINQVSNQQQRYNNNEEITKSTPKTKLKLIYYQILFYFYRLQGQFLEFAFVNSTWTQSHIKQTWRSIPIIKLYPPCQVDAFMKRKKFTDQFIIVSFAQFRPEKQQMLQVEIIEALVERLPSDISQSIKLYMVGSVRGSEDEMLFNEIYETIQKKNLQNYIQMYKNLPFDQLIQTVSSGMIGLHTMEYEHFGITLVEMLAAGLIVAAHNSAGPKLDILCDGVGFLCKDLEEYVMAIVKVMQMTDEERREYQLQGRKQAIKFSDESFIEQFSI